MMLNIKPLINGMILLISFLFIATFSTCRKDNVYKSFKPGELWLDNKGVHINAHGGGILFSNGVY